MSQPRRRRGLAFSAFLSILYAAGLCWSDERNPPGPKFSLKLTGRARYVQVGDLNRHLDSFNSLASVGGEISRIDNWSSDHPLSQEIRARQKRVDEKPERNDALRFSRARQTWARTYGDAYDDYASAIVPTADGGYIIAGGTRRQTEVTVLEALILKLSSDGGIEWQHAYPGIREASSIKQTADGGFIVSGSAMIADSYDSDFWLLKLGSGGAVEWERTYGGAGDDQANSVWPAADGGYIAAGTTESPESDDEDAWILKLFSDGQIEWQRRCGGSADEVVESIIQTDDGGYIAAGYITPPETGWDDFLVLKLTSTGEIEWQTTFGREGSDRAHSVIQTHDRGYLLAGEVGRMIAVVKLFPDGNMEWQHVYTGFPGSGGYAHSAEQTGDGGYMISGSVHAGIRGMEILLMKLSSDGQIQWQLCYGGQREDDEGRNIGLLRDGGYVVAAQTQAFGAGKSDILVLRLDAEGKIERFPEISGVTWLLPGDFPLAAGNPGFLSRETSAVALPAAATYYFTSKKTGLIFSPPYLSGRRFLNRSLSQAEYVDSLTWEPNPNNSDLNIVKYRLRFHGGYPEDRILAELSPQSHTFLVRNVESLAWNVFSLSGVTDIGEEGMRSYVDIMRLSGNR